MLRICLPLALALSLSLAGLISAGDSPAAPAPAPAAGGGPSSAAAPGPEATLKTWVKAVRTNDLAALYHALPAIQRAALERTWTMQCLTPDADADLQVTTTLALLLSPSGTDLLVARASPQLLAINPQDLVIGLQQVGGFLALAGSQPKPAAGAPAIDYQAAQAFLADIGAWIPTAGLTDQGKLRSAIGHLILAAKALGVKNATEIRALKIEDLVRRLGMTLDDLKAAVMVYCLDVNALLDSVAISVLDAAGEQRNVTIAYTAFGHSHVIPVKMVHKNEAWVLAEVKDSPFAPFSQLLLLGMTMSDALAPAPAPRAAPAAGGGGQPPL